MVAPFCGPHNLHEAGMAAITGTLRIELKRFGVQSITIETLADVSINKGHIEDRSDYSESGTKPHGTSSTRSSKSVGKRIDSSVSNRSQSNRQQNADQTRARNQFGKKYSNGQNLTRNIFDSSTNVLLSDYGEDYVEYMRERLAVSVSCSSAALLEAVHDAVWNYRPKPWYTVIQSRRANFIQSNPILAQMLPSWFVDQMLMFNYKNSPLPLVAPDIHDDHDD